MVIILHKTQPKQSILSLKCWELWQEVLGYYFLWLFIDYSWMTSRGISLKINLLGPHYTTAASSTTSIVRRRVESVMGILLIYFSLTLTLGQRSNFKVKQEIEGTENVSEAQSLREQNGQEYEYKKQSLNAAKGSCIASKACPIRVYHFLVDQNLVPWQCSIHVCICIDQSHPCF